MSRLQWQGVIWLSLFVVFYFVAAMGWPLEITPKILVGSLCVVLLAMLYFAYRAQLPRRIRLSKQDFDEHGVYKGRTDVFVQWGSLQVDPALGRVTVVGNLWLSSAKIGEGTFLYVDGKVTIDDKRHVVGLERLEVSEGFEETGYD